MKKIEVKSIDIFCGTGGVGKTTIATSRAIWLAQQNKKVLLITIDPSKRLKQIIGLCDRDEGEIIPITLESNNTRSISFDAMLMSPSVSLKKIMKLSPASSFSNRIIEILFRSNGGMNELMSVIEVQKHLISKKYDTIVLDTPPGKHFLDFLGSASKIQQFFENNFIEIFTGLKNSLSGKKSQFNIIKNIANAGINKILEYLERVTGKNFINDFINALNTIYTHKDVFLDAINFQQLLKKSTHSNWFLVTSASQNKVEQASMLTDKSKQLIHDDNFIIINKSLIEDLNKWNIDNSTNDKKTNQSLHCLKESMIMHEKKIKDVLQNKGTIISFPEIIDTTPENHVKELSLMWRNFCVSSDR